jgi:hypothetical protein
MTQGNPPAPPTLPPSPQVQAAIKTMVGTGGPPPSTSPLVLAIADLIPPGPSTNPAISSGLREIMVDLLSTKPNPPLGLTKPELHADLAGVLEQDFLDWISTIESRSGSPLQSVCNRLASVVVRGGGITATSSEQTLGLAGRMLTASAVVSAPVPPAVPHG